MEILPKPYTLFRGIRFGGVRKFGSSSVYDATSTSDLPVITTPQKMVQKLEMLKDRKRQNRKTTASNRKGPLIISCQRKDYNFRRNEKFNKETDFYKLVSCGWKNRKRNGDQFTLMSHGNNPSIQGENAVMFEELGISTPLCERLHNLGYETPTHIQRLAIPPLLRGGSVICAAETGSGKTLSYLLPAMERITQLKNALKDAQCGRGGSDRDEGNCLGNPHTVIISPNRELTEQVMSVSQSLASSLDVIPQCVVGGTTKKSALRQYASIPMDILITTPGILNKMLAARCVKKSNLQSIVIDESDTLLDDSFLGDVHNILDRFQVSLSDGPVESHSPFLSGIQLAIVSATMPRDLDSAIGHILPVDSMTKVTTRGLHRLMPHVPQTFHRINPDSKPEKLIQLLKTSTANGQVSLVFSKNSKTCFYLRHLLQEHGIGCQALNGDMTAQERDGVFSQFKEGYFDVLVATDIASRGLDTTHVQHVINYDFPNFLSDYVHRVGRVGRVGARETGCVTSFVSHVWEVELLWKIESSARMGSQFENVNANIKRKLQRSRGGHGQDVFTISSLS